jgi:aminoglycoside phosphotransferase (APT) family kinase protein
VLAARKRGVCDIEAWPPARDDGSPPGEQLAKHLAHLHRLPTDVAGTGAQSSTRDSLQSFIAGIAGRWMRDRPFDDPLVQLGFDWLQDNVPRDVPQLALVHGDLSERNILIDQGKISAILDWELWHVGDPVYDLAYVRRLVEKIMSWDRFLEVYRASGGPPCNLANLSYWLILSEFRNVAMLASGLRTFVDGRNRNLKIITPVMRSYRERLMLGMQALLPLLR